MKMLRALFVVEDTVFISYTYTVPFQRRALKHNEFV